MTGSPASRGSLTHEPDRFSNPAWDLLLAGQDVARRWRHDQLDVEHLIQVLFSDPAFRRWVDPLPIRSGELLDRLEDVLADQPAARGDALFIGDDLEELLESADRVRSRWGERLIDVPQLIAAVGDDPRIGADLFTAQGLEANRLEGLLRPALAAPMPAPMPMTASVPVAAAAVAPPAKAPSAKAPAAKAVQPSPSPTPVALASSELEVQPSALDAYGRDLTAEAEAGSLDPVIGRDSEIRNLIKVLSRRSKNNPVLIGEPGVGKTAIAELLAQRIVAGEVPESLQGLRLIALDLGALIAGAKFRGQFEERLRSVLEEVSRSDSGVVLFIDELHTVVGSDRSSTDAASC